MCSEKINVSIDRDVLDRLVGTGIGGDYVSAMMNTLRLAGLARLFANEEGAIRLFDEEKGRYDTVRAFDKTRRG